MVAGAGTAVVDLGTEFGLNVDQQGKIQGKVFRGMVEAALLSESGAYRRTRTMDPSNAAFELDPKANQIAPNARRPDTFLEAVRPPVVPLVLDPGYRASILKSKPWSYWRFESLREETVPNEIAGGPVLRVRGPLRLSPPVQGNASIVFEPGHSDQVLELDGRWTPPCTGFALELLVPLRVHRPCRPGHHARQPARHGKTSR